ncbi:L10-interacting MYB domain-containing protein [Carex littledalei]|uniref:L10-interacting MYB domain-containing protein n=1 Tax=Carex littledalei TaxID=544730 RepID=A0A833QJC2_9POAL|nr:L10-interacting MYB domain-containing protein [Carex littledalei]
MKMDTERTRRDEIKAKRRLRGHVWDKRDGSGRKPISESSSSRSRTANWTHSLDVALLTILKQEYIEGNFVNGQFTKSSWSHIVPAFNDKTRLNFTKDHLRNRLKVLRNLFRPYDELAVMSGWAWDPEHNVPRPNDPADWDRVVAINPQYAKCRERPCPEYPILKLFFTKNATNQTQLDAMAVELTDKDEGSSSSLRLPEKSTPNHHPHYSNNTPPPPPPHPAPSPPPPRYPTTNEYNCTYNELDDNSSSEITEKSLNITKALEELVELSRRQQEIIQDILTQELSFGLKPYSTEQCIAKLKTVRNLSAQAFLAVCEAFRDKHERRVFMSLEGKTLYAWIEKAVLMQAQPVFPQPLQQHFCGDHNMGNTSGQPPQSQEVNFP